jgi:hypothetical protein
MATVEAARLWRSFVGLPSSGRKWEFQRKRLVDL